MSFWAFRQSTAHLSEVEKSNIQRNALMQTRAWLLQASTSLNKAGTLTALSYPPDDIKALMKQAKDNLKDADNSINNEFLSIPALQTDEGKRLQDGTKVAYTAWHGDLNTRPRGLKAPAIRTLCRRRFSSRRMYLIKTLRPGSSILTTFVETAKAEVKAITSAQR